MFENDTDTWWVTGGGYFGLGDVKRSTEVFDVLDNGFEFSVDLPKVMRYHNLVNVNNTHMVLLGGQDTSNDIFVIDR